MVDSGRTIVVKVFRFNPEEDESPRFDAYEIPYEKGQTILGVLRRIYEEYDSSLAFYRSCRIGKCRGCHVRVNGTVHLACTTIAADDNILIEPVPGREIVRDLVVDRTQAGTDRRADEGTLVPDQPEGEP